MGHPTFIFATKIAEAGCYALAEQLTLLQTKTFKNYGIQTKSKHRDEQGADR